jgi:hypothetical protein
MYSVYHVDVLSKVLHRQLNNGHMYEELSKIKEKLA